MVSTIAINVATQVFLNIECKKTNVFSSIGKKDCYLHMEENKLYFTLIWSISLGGWWVVGGCV
jgi:hypothetical protein